MVVEESVCVKINNYRAMIAVGDPVKWGIGMGFNVLVQRWGAENVVDPC